jgi:hypothetical protein
LCKFGQRASSFARNDTEENAKAKFKNAGQRPAVQKAKLLGDKAGFALAVALCGRNVENRDNGVGGKVHDADFVVRLPG